MISRFAVAPLYKPKVLLVEDDEAVCNMYADVLRLEGFQIRMAFDGISALRLIETYEPDVVILDLKLPMASGFEVAQELRTTRVYVPLIAVSGHERGLERARRSRDFFAALQKPLDPDELIGITRRATHRLH